MNSVKGAMPNEVCALRSPAGLLETLEADCDGEIICSDSCCTACFGVSS